MLHAAPRSGGRGQGELLSGDDNEDDVDEDDVEDDVDEDDVDDIVDGEEVEFPEPGQDEDQWTDDEQLMAHGPMINTGKAAWYA